ncbi:flagellar biosynthesis anti-sigma factor FlgM [Jeotgalibacillus proteolyticus]|uniref:Negative regulator of flagellin synthesis n=1 Tax=Jeotgalibacillus proteolyticus TaxID=2082395 RepID=A0A2S5GB58_9BACL|nr:flagellar biosynthesis anti-sigma factor FlgM [Jeotgalibacillus proteolyticus]PPA70252.1 flagellar biosynthesis anti-sigma factor FlgM [Jeotgalibacillus proteolyticus]
MKINSVNSANINPYKQQQTKIDQMKTQHVQQADKVEISTRAKEMQETNRIQTERKEKVDQLKTEVENGTYKLEPNRIAADLAKFFQK